MIINRKRWTGDKKSDPNELNPINYKEQSNH